MKDLSNTIRKFEKILYKSYETRRPKHETTNSYFYLARQLAECMMRADVLNFQVYPVRTEMTGTQQIPISHVFYTDESESKEFLVDETLSQVCSTNEYGSKIFIAEEISTEESISGGNFFPKT